MYNFTILTYGGENAVVCAKYMNIEGEYVAFWSSLGIVGLYFKPQVVQRGEKIKEEE